jgi:hypothetical protein
MEPDMDPAEIWQTIIKADDLLKYATEDKAALRKGQAAALLREALVAAETAGHEQLAGQARTRLADLGES